MVKIRKFDYPDLIMETVLINKRIKKDFAKLCKEKKINKSKFIEDIYKTILLRYRSNALDVSNYITIQFK